ncbi:MAG: EAL domain-containing protein, partial [Xanthomonadales bacterium]|nr:EAL domain-containing protein [Xanthomonadales bacterium]
LGEVGPDQFITYAETTGDIVPIGAWVIREACRQLREWLDQGLDIERVAVNVSYRQFLSEELHHVVVAALGEFHLPPEALELEITERVLIEDVSDTVETFATLKELGVTLTIDDFGEGYSALNYLRRLPIDGVKISHSFLRGVPEQASDVAICQAIIGIAQSLGLDLIAEGVESPVQREFLLAHGVSNAQGYLFSKPRPGDDIPDYQSPGPA